jgi:putative endonuclease
VVFLYVLRCAGNTLYIGVAADVVRRVEQHSAGRGCVFTARRRPVALVYTESFPSRSLAMRREKQLKRWTRAKKEALIAGDIEQLRRL